MEMRKKLNGAFHIVCLFATLILVAKCLNEYLADEDLTRVEYRKYHSNDENLYPSTSFCWWHPIWGSHKFPNFLNTHQYRCNPTGRLEKDKCNKKGKVWDAQYDYIRFLEGNLDGNEEFQKADYDKLTMPLREVIYEVKLSLRDGV